MALDYSRLKTLDGIIAHYVWLRSLGYISKDQVSQKLHNCEDMIANKPIVESEPAYYRRRIKCDLQTNIWNWYMTRSTDKQSKSAFILTNGYYDLPEPIKPVEDDSYKLTLVCKI